MAYKVNAERVGDGSGYNLSFGKGAKKLTTKMHREPSGLFRIEGIGLGVKGDMIDKWRAYAEATYKGEEPPPVGDDVMAGDDVVTGACPSMETGLVATPIMPQPKPPGPPPAIKRGPPVLPPRKGPPSLPPRRPLPPGAQQAVQNAEANPGTFHSLLDGKPAVVASPTPPPKKPPVDKGSGPVMAKFGTAAELATPVGTYRVSLHNGDLILVLSGTPFKLEGEKGRSFAFDVAELMKG